MFSGSCRLCVEALRWMARMGAPWRQLPRTARGTLSIVAMPTGATGAIWPRRMAYLQADPDLFAVRLDSTVVRAHVNAEGAPQNQGTDSDLGRSRPGGGTKIRILAERRGRPLRLRVTGGPRHDST